MGTVFENGAFWFLCHSRELSFEPPHVHVKVDRGQEARICLIDDEWLDPKPPKAADAMKMYHQNKALCVAAWNKMHPRREIV